MVEWRAPLLCITEVSDSNLGPHKAHHDVDLVCGFTHYLLENPVFFFKTGHHL